MTVLVTGGAGYIGSHAVIELLSSGNQVIIVDNFYNSQPEVLKRIKELSGKDFKFYEVDVLNKEDFYDGRSSSNDSGAYRMRNKEERRKNNRN